MKSLFRRDGYCFGSVSSAPKSIVGCSLSDDVSKLRKGLCDGSHNYIKH